MAKGNDLKMDQLIKDRDKFTGKTENHKNGFTNTFHEINVKPDGIGRFTMYRSNGVHFENLIEFINIVEPERLEYLDRLIV